MESTALVIDLGSGTVKYGLGGEDAPRKIFPTMVGRPKNPGIMVGMDAHDAFVGNEAFSHRGILRLHSPLSRGHVSSWVDWEKIMHHIFWSRSARRGQASFLIDLSQQPVLLADELHSSSDVRAGMAQRLFETFGVSSLSLVPSNMLPAYSSGRTTALVVGSGDTVSSVTPVHEGAIAISPAAHRTKNSCRFLPLGGRDVTDRLIELLKVQGDEESSQQLLQEVQRRRRRRRRAQQPPHQGRKRSHPPAIDNLDLSEGSRDWELARLMKEKEGLCFVSQKYIYEYDRSELGKLSREVYEFADGHKVRIAARPRFLPCEILFPGLAEEVVLSLSLSSLSINRMNRTEEGEGEDLRSQLAANVVLAGGNTKFGGFGKRLRKEVLKAFSQKKRKKKTDFDLAGDGSFRVHCPEEDNRCYSAFVGGSILASLETFQSQFVSAEEYSERGVDSIQEKYFGAATVQQRESNVGVVPVVEDDDESGSSDYGEEGEEPGEADLLMSPPDAPPDAGVVAVGRGMLVVEPAASVLAGEEDGEGGTGTLLTAPPREQLNAIRRKIFRMKNSEIRSQMRLFVSRPPPPIIRVVRSALVALGNSPENVNTWSKAQNLVLSPGFKTSLKRLRLRGFRYGSGLRKVVKEVDPGRDLASSGELFVVLYEFLVATIAMLDASDYGSTLPKRRDQ